METKKCCFCGETINGIGNNPNPACTIPGAVCCDKCNEETVIPVRLFRIWQKTRKEEEAE